MSNLFDCAHVQKQAVELQQGWCDTDSQVFWVHFVLLGSLDNVVQQAEQVLQQDPVGFRKLRNNPNHKKNRTINQSGAFFPGSV